MAGLQQGQAVYEGMNVLVRRSAKENNFKAVSEGVCLSVSLSLSLCVHIICYMAHQPKIYTSIHIHLLTPPPCSPLLVQVLETIRGLMNTTAAVVGKAVPPWLHDVFLGYGDPRQAHYRQLALEEQVSEG